LLPERGLEPTERRGEDDHGYRQVYFDTNRVIRQTFGDAGFPAAEQPIVVRTDGRPTTPARVPAA
jgi:hypothetical protein